MRKELESATNAISQVPENDDSGITVIVPQFNQPELTINCLRSLSAVHASRPQLIVVDDGSSGDAAARVGREFPTTYVVRQPHQGVTAAWNHGARLATTRLLVFLNNDAESHGPWLDWLAAPLWNPEILMTGAGDRSEPTIGQLILDRAPPRRLLEGWCFAVRRSDFVEINGFDESLRLYFSDTDLQLRLWERFGSSDSALHVVRGLPIRHGGHRTTRTVAGRRSIWRHDRQRFVEKWSAERVETGTKTSRSA